MSTMTIVEIKAFVPARDFARSKKFYEDLGFEVAWSSDDLAYLRHGEASFLLQSFYNEAHAGWSKTCRPGGNMWRLRGSPGSTA